MNKPRRRLTVGLMMLLVGVASVAIWGFAYSRRLQLVFNNRSPSQVRSVKATWAGGVRDLGPVAPRSHSSWRIAAPPGESVRVSFVVQGKPGEADRHLEAPAITTCGAGQMISVGYASP